MFPRRSSPAGELDALLQDSAFWDTQWQGPCSVTDFPFSFFSLGSKLFKYVSCSVHQRCAAPYRNSSPFTIRKIIGRRSRAWVLRASMGIGAEREERDYLNKLPHRGLRDS